MKYKIDSKQCSGCGQCIIECPAAAIYPTEKGAKMNKRKCDGCGLCIEVCPFYAITPDNKK